MITQLRNRLRDESGFSVTELMTAVAVLGVLFAVFAAIMSTTFRHSTREQAAIAIQTEARRAIERFASELRQAYSGDGSWPIQNVSSNTIRFLSPDRAVPFHLRRIDWRLSGGDLQRRSVTSTNTDGPDSPPWTGLHLIDAASWTTEVRSLRNTTVFQFLDGAEPPAATTVAANVRRVVVTVEVATDGTGSNTYTYTTSVTPRVSET